MALLKIPIDSGVSRALLISSRRFRLAVAAVSAKWGMGNTLATRSQEKEVTDLGVTLAPDDPLARLSHAAVLEKTFDMNDIAGSLREYETAAAMSPHDFRLWLGLGRDASVTVTVPVPNERSDAASRSPPELSRALRWALGNLLVCEGRTDEGFAEIRKAADSDTAFAAPAVAAAWLAFDGDVDAVSRACSAAARTRARTRQVSRRSRQVRRGRHDMDVAARRCSRTQLGSCRKLWGQKFIECPLPCRGPHRRGLTRRGSIR